jgi:hypothetical protein
MFTTENIFEYVKKHVHPRDIYQKYIDDVVFDKLIQSPLRNDDTNPSFIIYSDTWVFVDYRYLRGDWLKFVCYKYNLNYSKAIEKIAKDFNLLYFSNNDKTTFVNYTFPTKSQTFRYKKQFKPVVRSWGNADKLFWNQFTISKKTLEHFNVKPILGFWTFNKLSEWSFFKTDYVSYVYFIGSRLKIYQPKRTKNNYKFLGNTTNNSIQGYTQIDFNKPELIITSSLKDVMLLYEFGYQAIAPSSESTVISKFLIDFLLDNFNQEIKIKLFYDWDEPGIELANKHKEIYNANIIIPDNYKKLIKQGVKDPSDFQKHFNNINKTKNFLKKCLQNTI